MVRQAQKEGQAKAASPEVARVASSIKKSDAKDFASTKHKGLPEKKKMNEEGYDHYRDNILMKGGDHRSKETKNKSYTPSKPVKGKTAAQKAAKGKSALDIVKANIRKQYGKGAIMGEDVNCADRKEMAAQHKAVHNKKKDETGGMPATVTAKNRRGQMQGVDEAKVDQGRSDYGKASIRNYRRSGPGHDDPGMFDPEGKRGKTIEKRRAEHKARRGVKGAKVPAYKTEARLLETPKFEKGKSDKEKSKRRNQRDGLDDEGKASTGNYEHDVTRLHPAEADDLRYMDHEDKRGVKKKKGVKEETALDRAKRNIGRDPNKKTCWTGYKAKGTKMKGGKSVPNCVKESDIASILARLEKKRISKGGDPEKSPLPSMKKYHADKKKKVEEGVMGMMKRAVGVKAKKTTGRDAGAIAAKIMRDKEQKKYVSFLPANEGIKYDSKGSSMDYFLGADPKKTKEYKALKKKKTQKEGTSYGLYRGSGKPSGAMKKYLDKKAKMLTKKRDAQSDAAKNNPHFDSTQPSPSGRNKYEHVSFKNYFTEGNNTARMLHKSKTSVTGNISADRGGDEKKNQASRKGLEKDLKKKGIGYKKGVGKYKYDSGETGTEVSYQTSKPDKMSKRRFGKTMRRLGRKHGQESVITKDKSKPARLHDTESKKPGKSINIGKSKGGSNPSGMGQTSGDKVRSGKLPNKSKKGAYHYG